MVLRKLLSIILMLIMVFFSTSCIELEKKTNQEEVVLTTSCQNIMPSIYDSPAGINNSANQKYNVLYSSQTEYNEVPYVKSNVYSRINEICENIDFYGDFNSRPIENNRFFLNKFYEVLLSREEYINMIGDDRITNKEFDLDNYQNYTYYLFDIDKDSNDELIIDDNVKYIFVFKYNNHNGKILLIHVLRNNSQFMGGNKIGNWNAGTGLTYGYYELAIDGKKSEIRFYSANYFDGNIKKEEEIYLVGFPEDIFFKDYIIVVESDNATMDVYFDELTRTAYLRVSKEQYTKLTETYFNSLDISKKEIDKTKHSFKELFEYYTK